MRGGSSSSAAAVHPRLARSPCAGECGEAAWQAQTRRWRRRRPRRTQRQEVRAVAAAGTLLPHPHAPVPTGLPGARAQARAAQKERRCGPRCLPGVGGVELVRAGAGTNAPPDSLRVGTQRRSRGDALALPDAGLACGPAGLPQKSSEVAPAPATCVRAREVKESSRECFRGCGGGDECGCRGGSAELVDVTVGAPLRGVVTGLVARGDMLGKPCGDEECRRGDSMARACAARMRSNTGRRILPAWSGAAAALEMARCGGSNEA